MAKDKKLLQWHPAFFAGLQIELQEDVDHLTFLREYQLGTKPKQIDVLVIKKDANYSVKKNFGRFFRKYNIFEYKSPTDYLSIDDFYIGYAYVCLCKVDTASIDERKITDLTLTFVTYQYPQKFVQHLIKIHKYQIQKQEEGIYSIIGDVIPIQLLITSQLNENENLWLHVLSNQLDKHSSVITQMFTEYVQHKDNALYDSVMDIVIRANNDSFFKEENPMCQAFENVMNQKLEAREARGIEIGEARGEARLLAAKRQMVINLHNQNMPIEQIAAVVEEPVQTVMEWLQN